MTGAGDKMEVEDAFKHKTKWNEMQINVQINDMQNCKQDVRKPIINVGLFTSELFCV